uniref:Peroxin-7 n=1 Tax=Timspurckia oligopyrenoides TaxID=708627 RepID=A0A7S1EV04_9RHOD|mmetsp:Transcript_942/g.1762  ORF Transcript_942/g.1762 Transcript_942/m.1762 type:complete len:443 (+) Transcript_942:17-1345(+)
MNVNRGNYGRKKAIPLSVTHTRQKYDSNTNQTLDSVPISHPISSIPLRKRAKSNSHFTPSVSLNKSDSNYHTNASISAFSLNIISKICWISSHSLIQSISNQITTQHHTPPAFLATLSTPSSLSPSQIQFYAAYNFMNDPKLAELFTLEAPKSTTISDLAEVHSRIACACNDSCIRIYDLDSKSCCSALGNSVFSSSESVSSVCSFNGISSSNSQRLGSTGSCGTVSIFDINQEQSLWSNTTDRNLRNTAESVGYLCSIALESDVIAAGGISGRVDVYDVRTNDSVVSSLYCGTHTRLRSVKSDESSSHFVFAGSNNGELIVWDRRYISSSTDSESMLMKVQAHSGPIWDISLVSNRPGLLLSCAEDGRVLSWDFGTASQSFNSTATTEFWSAQVSESDVHIVADTAPYAVNAIHAHPAAELVAYGTDSAEFTVQTLDSLTC